MPYSREVRRLPKELQSVGHLIAKDAKPLRRAAGVNDTGYRLPNGTIVTNQWIRMITAAALPFEPRTEPEPLFIAKGSRFADFFRRAWPIVETATLKWNWHLDAMCDHLQAVYEGKVRDLVINVPPGFSKSTVTCVFWPAWVWAQDPTYRMVFASYSEEFSMRDATKTLDLVNSSWYHATAPHVVLRYTRPKRGDFGTNDGGFRLATSISGKVSGKRADIIVADDPHKLEESNSEAKRNAVIEWWRRSVSTRGAERGLRRVVIMQRLHEQDLSGVCLEDGFEHLVVPMEYGKTARRCSWTGWSGDPRSEPGELAWPEHQPADPERGLTAAEATRAFVEKQKIEQGSRGYDAMWSQEPEPASGVVWKREWFKFFDVPPAQPGMLSTSWDMTFKGNDDSDFVVGLVIARVGGDYYVLHEERGRWEFTDTLAAFKRVAAKYPDATAHYIEDTANGPAIISSLRKEISGIIAVKPDGDKYSRAQAVAPMLQAGNVYLPAGAAWVDEFIAECTKFPNGKNDDRVDALSQGLNRMRKGWVW